MARTLVLDGLLVKRLAVVRSQGGQLEVSAEYDLLSAGKPVGSKFVTFSSQQAGPWQAALASMFAAVGQQAAATELS